MLPMYARLEPSESLNPKYVFVANRPLKPSVHSTVQDGILVGPRECNPTKSQSVLRARTYIGGGVRHRFIDDRITFGFRGKDRKAVLRFERGGLAAIAYPSAQDSDALVILGKFNIFQQNIGPKLSSGSFVSSVSGVPATQERNNSDDSADDSQRNLNPCRYFLPFSGCSASIGGIGSFLLGSQIGCLVFCAFVFALFGAGNLLRGL